MRVKQVTTAVSLTENVDYVITSKEPFTESGAIDFRNLDHAVVILESVKPSLAKAYLPHVTINGAAAVPEVNCQVKVYGAGTIIMPYASDLVPFYGYSEKGQTGIPMPFTEGQTVSLSNGIYNNKMRSFTLKRGYMVCLGTRADGSGYSRLFIADKEDRAIDLPEVLDHRVSMVRVMRWNDVNKRGYAGSNQNANNALNTTWCYNWDASDYHWDDREYVTQHHHEGWPSIANVGNNGSSPNALANNEPDNTADDREKVSSVSEVLRNWPAMMATGKRLGSPAVASNLNWLYEFIDSIDAKGWRCDFVAVHAYWYADWWSWQNDLRKIHERTKRPIWLTEMNYGANWTGWPGSNTSGNDANYAIEKQHLAPIIDGLEAEDYIERYAIYNQVQDCRRVWLGDSRLTPAGEYYANKSSHIAFNSSKGFTPSEPSLYDPYGLTAFMDGNEVNLKWNDRNGEYNDSMFVERQLADGTWTKVASVRLVEVPRDYTYTVADAAVGDVFRIHVIDMKGTDRYSNTATSARAVDEVGDEVSMDGHVYYLGGNQMVNGDFDFGTLGWTDGKAQPLGQPMFEVFPRGSRDGGAYLQAFGHTGSEGPASVKKAFDLQPQANYYIGVMHKNNSGSWQKVSLSTDGKAENKVILSLGVSSDWAKESATFSSGSYPKMLLSYRWLDYKSAYDKFYFARLFESRQEAYADGIAQTHKYADEWKQYNTLHPALNEMLDQELAAISGQDSAAWVATQQTIENAWTALRHQQSLDSLLTVAQALLAVNLPGKELLAEKVADAASVATFADIAQRLSDLSAAVNAYFPAADQSAIIANADFSAGADNWEKVSDAYQEGDQRATTQKGRTCWNAWWSSLAAASGDANRLDIHQQIKNLRSGFYQLSCDATTQHYCLSDQHAYMTVGKTTTISPVLKADWLDVPDVEAVWQTLTTTPLYANDGDSLTIGFTSTKTGATDYAWRKYNDAQSTGDRREGWWCATGFKLAFVPAYQREQAGWQTLCLPYAAVPSDNVRVYELAGIDSTGTAVILSEVSEMVAGKPYVYYSYDGLAVFREKGNAVNNPVSAVNGLKGAFKPVALGSSHFVLRDGQWQRAAENDTLPASHAYLMDVNQLPFLPVSEESITLDIVNSGVTGIAAASRQAQEKRAIYTISGHKVDKIRHQGVYIIDGKKVLKP